MSCEDYTPEIHNHPLNENPDDDYEPSSSEESELIDDFDTQKIMGDKINDMIKEEVSTKFASSHPKMKDAKEFQYLKTEEFKKLSNDEKIKAVAVAFNRHGGINVSNILELKMLIVLIEATEQMEGFTNFPRQQVLEILEMLIYHANKHLEILDV